MTTSTLPWQVLQAPIGACCCPQLVAAVSNSGGLGAFAFTWKTPAEISTLVAQTRQLTSKPFQANFVLQFPVQEQLIAALDAGVSVVTFSWGIPDKALISRLRDRNVSFGIQVVTQNDLDKALKHDPTFLIVQGQEAGGHVQADDGLTELLTQLMPLSTGKPIVAAGGIATPQDAERLKAMGVAGVMLGTRFVASQASLAHPTYKRLLLSATADDTVLTTCFDGGWPNAPHRVLRNTTFEKWIKAGCPSVGARPEEDNSPACDSTGKPEARYSDNPPLMGYRGAVTEMCLYSGLGVGQVTAISPVSEIVEQFMAVMDDGRDG